MKDIMGLMSKAKEMQAKMQAMQAEMETVEAEGVSGGGAVKVRLNGKGAMTGISIDASLVQPGEGEIIATLDGANLSLDFVEFWHDPHKHVLYNGTKM